MEHEDFSFKQYFFPLTSVKIINFLLILGFIIFSFSLFNNFVGDDNTQILDNPTIHSLSNVPSFFFENRLTSGGKNMLGGLYFKPFLDLSYAALFSLFGPNYFFFHLFQLLLFLSNACLVFLLFKHFFNKNLSFFLSLIFLVHPINSEAALYIATTQDVLFFFFGILSLLLLKNLKSFRWLALIIICLLFSLLSKETGLLFFLILPLYAFLEKKSSLFPLALGSSFALFLYAALRLHAVGLSRDIPSAPIARLDLLHRLLNIPSMFIFYLKTFLLPVVISGSWQWAYTDMSFTHFFIPLFLSLSFLLALVIFALYLFKEEKKYFKIFLFFAFWFLLGVGFHMQIFPLDQTTADRWFYFPSVGMLGMLGVLLSVLHVNFKNLFVYSLSFLLILLLSVKTFVRSFDYKDDFTLASHDAKISRDSYNSEYILSHEYYKRGDLKKAKIHALRSIKLFPYITNYTNLGAIESRMGNYPEAEKAYLNALKYGSDALPYENLSSLALVYGDPGSNISFLKNTALKKYPENGFIWFNLAVLEYKYGDKESAKSSLKRARISFQDPNVNFVDYVMASNKPLYLKTSSGNLTFYTY